MHPSQWTLLTLLLPLAAPAQQAPFCVFSGAGSQCYYYNLQACQSAARTLQGMCAPNQAQAPQRYGAPVQPVTVQPQQPLQYCDGYIIGNYCTPDPGKKVMEAYNQARKQKMEREEHEARMALIRAQTQAISAPAQQYAPARRDAAGQVRQLYRCVANGEPYYNDRDEGGCTYLGGLPALAPQPN